MSDWILVAKEHYLLDHKLVPDAVELWSDFVSGARIGNINVGDNALLVQAGTGTIAFWGRGKVEAVRRDGSEVRYVERFSTPFVIRSDIRSRYPSLASHAWKDGRVPIFLALTEDARGMYVPGGMTGVAFPLSPEDAAILTRTISSNLPRSQVRDSDSGSSGSPTEPSERSPGQGFSGDSAEARLLEGEAMRVAKVHFEKEGFTVLDEHVGHPYDLRCTRGTITRYVEVKGTSSEGRSVLVTRGEVQFAREHTADSVLFVCHSLRVEAGKVSGGVVEIESPWDPSDDSLDPTGYSYKRKP